MDQYCHIYWEALLIWQLSPIVFRTQVCVIAIMYIIKYVHVLPNLYIV